MAGTKARVLADHLSSQQKAAAAARIERRRAVCLKAARILSSQEAAQVRVKEPRASIALSRLTAILGRGDLRGRRALERGAGGRGLVGREFARARCGAAVIPAREAARLRTPATEAA